MKKIELGNGMTTMVDDEDFEMLSRHRWYARKDRNIWYAVRSTSNNVKFRMHRIIANAPNGILIDHINGDGLDNRKINLRFATNSQNQMNRKTSTSSCGFKGVVFCKNKISKPWKSQIVINKSYCFLGYYHTCNEAAMAYDFAAITLFGERSSTNFKSISINKDISNYLEYRIKTKLKV